MKKLRTYKRHQAFNAAHKELTEGSDARADGFVAPKRYHHKPDKLVAFTDYKGYFFWSTELYASSGKLVSSLRGVLDEANRTTPRWYSYRGKRCLNEILDSLNSLKPDLDDLYDDIFEFQNCMLATDIGEKHSQIEPLSDQVRYLTALEDRIVETCSRKLYEINSTRVALAGVFIGLCALIVAFVSASKAVACQGSTPNCQSKTTAYHL